MRTADLFRLTGSNLKRTRGRAIMTALGVLIGTAAIVILIALASGLQANTLNSFEGFGEVNQITVFPSAGFRAFGGERSSSSDVRLTTNALRDLAKIEGVTAVTPIENIQSFTTLKYTRFVGTANITGIDPKAAPEMSFDIEKGTDRLGGYTAIVGGLVGAGFADPRTGEAATPAGEAGFDLYGQTLTLELQRSNDEGKIEKKTVRIRVGGVLKEGVSTDNTIYLALDDVEDLNLWATGDRPDRAREGYNQATVVTESSEVTLGVQDQIEAMGFGAFSSGSIIQELNVFFAIIQAVFGGIGAISLLVAAIGISNTMVMSILERTREIGLMKAVGATNRDVLSVFITEAGAIGVMGGIGGVITGAVVSQILNVIAGAYITSQAAASNSTPTDPVNIVLIPVWLPIFAIFFSLVIGLASGIYPAVRAVQLNPVTALKYE